MQENSSSFFDDKKELVGTSVALLILVVIIAALGMQHIYRLLYEERAENAGALMAQISHNIEDVMTDSWDSLEREADLIAAFAPESEEEVLKITGSMDRTYAKRGDGLFFIDDKGMCHASNGRIFRWADADGLIDGGSRLLAVSSIPSLGINEDRLIFIVKPESAVRLNDGTGIEYIASYTEHSLTEGILDKGTFDGKAVLFTIDSNGTFVYASDDDGILNDIYNFKARLEHWKFRYGTSGKMITDDMDNHVPGCALARTEQGDYFILSHPMEINDWTTVLMIPEELVGTSSKSFLRTVVLISFFILAVGFAVILYIVTTYNRKARAEQERVNERLQEAMESEKRASNAKTRFLSTFSHDIRTPMNSITGMVTIAKKHINDKAYVEGCIDKIMLSANHLLDLINDILDISKIESGKMVIAPGVFNIVDTVENIANMIMPRAREKKQHLDVEIHDVPKEFLVADQLRLNQIYVNLITNAVKYTSAMGRIRMEFYEELIPDDTDKVRTVFIVHDNGIGMTKEFMDTMFEPFSREKNPLSDMVEGSGLGLSICKVLVDLLGGAIECDSEHHKGTKFTVTIPMEVAGKEEVECFTRLSSGSDEDMGADLEGLHILVAEDNEINWEIAREELGLFGITTVRAMDGQECVNIIESAGDGEFDMILMDVQMPVLNGHEATKLIRKSKREYVRNIPVVAMTADAFAEDIRAAYDAGMDGHISKPIDINLMLYELRKARGKMEGQG